MRSIVSVVLVLLAFLGVALSAPALRASQWPTATGTMMNIPEKVVARMSNVMQVDEAEFDEMAVTNSMGKFFEYSIFDMFSQTPDDGLALCQQNMGETRLTLPLGHCMPDPLNMTAFVKGWATPDHSIKVWNYLDANCKESYDRKKFTPNFIGSDACTYGMKATVTDRRSPHPVGLVKKFYNEKGCEGTYGSVYWADNFCFMDAKTQYYILGSCASDSALLYYDFACGAYNPNAVPMPVSVSSYPGYDMCTRTGKSRFEFARCGGMAPMP